MEFRLLGSVALVTEKGDVPPGPVKRATLLAVLLLRPNAAVSVDQLTAALWEDEPPTHFKTVLQGHVSRLRALLAEHGAPEYGVELATQGTAYELRMPESLVDAHGFEELVALARLQQQPGTKDEGAARSRTSTGSAKATPGTDAPATGGLRPPAAPAPPSPGPPPRTRPRAGPVRPEPPTARPPRARPPAPTVTSGSRRRRRTRHPPSTSC